MPFPTEHAARQRTPGSFVENSFRRYTETLPAGVALLMGQPKDEDRMQVQSVRFNAAMWSPAEARAWLKRNEYSVDHFEQATQKARAGSKADDEDQSQPAKPSERRTGSRANDPESATRSGAKEIKLSEATEQALRNKMTAHNEKHGKKKGRRLNYRTLAAVYRRGAGAFSTSHRPGMTRNQWSMGRVNAFLHLVATGKPKDKKYITDNDLLPLEHPRAVQKGRYDDIDFTPPKDVSAAAARGLELRAKAPPSQRGGLTAAQAAAEGVGSGVQRASNLKNRDKVSPDTIKRMVSFFARHKESAKIDPKYKSEPHKDRGYVAHLLWGGDAGKRWAEKVKRQMDKADELKKAWEVSIPISKVNEEKRLAFGWASVIIDADGDAVIDHQSDRISIPELEKAAYEYVQKSRQSTEMHVRKGVAELVESVVITPEKREAMGIDGAGVSGWWVGFRVNDSSVWDKVKSGDYREFSIGGTAKRRSVDQ